MSITWSKILMNLQHITSFFCSFGNKFRSFIWYEGATYSKCIYKMENSNTNGECIWVCNGHSVQEFWEQINSSKYLGYPRWRNWKWSIDIQLPYIKWFGWCWKCCNIRFSRSSKFSHFTFRTRFHKVWYFYCHFEEEIMFSYPILGFLYTTVTTK